MFQTFSFIICFDILSSVSFLPKFTTFPHHINQGRQYQQIVGRNKGRYGQKSIEMEKGQPIIKSKFIGNIKFQIKSFEWSSSFWRMCLEYGNDYNYANMEIIYIFCYYFIDLPLTIVYCLYCRLFALIKVIIISFGKQFCFSPTKSRVQYKYGNSDTKKT